MIPALVISQIIVISALCAVYYIFQSIRISYGSLYVYYIDILLYPYILAVVIGIGILVIRKIQAVLSIIFILIALTAGNVMTLNALTPFGLLLLWILVFISCFLLLIGYVTQKSLFHWLALVIALICFFLIVSKQFASGSPEKGIIYDTTRLNKQRLDTSPVSTDTDSLWIEDTNIKSGV